MRRLLLPLLALPLLAAAPWEDEPVPFVRRWIAAARAHRPGEIDQALLGASVSARPGHLRRP